MLLTARTTAVATRAQAHVFVAAVLARHDGCTQCPGATAGHGVQCPALVCAQVMSVTSKQFGSAVLNQLGERWDAHHVALAADA